MRYTTGGIAHRAAGMEQELLDRETGLYKPPVKGLADLAASRLACRSVNTSELLSVLPRHTKEADSRSRYLHRGLKNPLIDPTAVRRGFIPEIAEVAGANGKTIVLMMEQSKMAHGFACLRVSMRVGERAIPVAWKGRKVKGNIGFEEQKPLLAVVAAMRPEGATILLAGDRFYGTAMLIDWCRKMGWNDRLRLKDHLILHHDGGEIPTGEAAKAQRTSLLAVRLTETGLQTHIGILPEAGHNEPGIIARSDPPSQGRLLDDGRRWGIEPMCSDFKSRGFGSTKTQRQQADRIQRLMLVLTVALYWAASTGMAPPEKPLQHTPKKKPAA
jgi:hypothetical protein